MSHSDRLVLQTAGVNDVWHYNELHLDSSARDAGSNDEPVFNLPVPIHDVMGLKVLAAQIPFSYHLIHDHNNTCTFYLYQNPGTPQATPFTLTIPPGTYTDPYDLAQVWQDEMNRVAAENVTQHWTYAVYFHPRTGTLEVFAKKLDGQKMTWQSNQGPTVGITDPADLFHGIAFSFPQDPNGESCAAMFGCQPNVVYGEIKLDDPTGPTAQQYVYEIFTDLINLTGPNYLQLFSNLGNKLSNNLLLNGSTTASPPVIAHIPVNTDPYEVIDYRDPNPSFLFDTSLSQIQSIQLSLRLGREENHILHLNNQSWSVILIFLTQRETTAGRHVYPDESSNKRIRVR